MADDNEKRFAALEEQINILKAELAALKRKAVTDAHSFMRLRDEVQKRYD